MRTLEQKNQRGIRAFCIFCGFIGFTFGSIIVSISEIFSSVSLHLISTAATMLVLATVCIVIGDMVNITMRSEQPDQNLEVYRRAGCAEFDYCALESPQQCIDFGTSNCPLEKERGDT